MGKTTKRKCLAPGNTVLGGRYEILKVIHTTGMANIYLVSDRNLNKQWCLKEIVKSEAGKKMIEYRSLLNEASILKNLNHSGIPRIVTIEEDGDSIFILMDYVEGLSIKEWLTKKGVIDQKVAVNWLKQVCGVLAYLHNRKNPIIYRDMKPDNIMVQNDGNVKLLDYGISVVITEDNQIIKEALGTKGYVAPEQRKVGSPYDLRSDIYALGKTMYHMLTGISPNVAGDNPKPLREVNANISVGLDIIVDKCTRRNPKDRYQSVEEVLYALNNYDKLDNKYRSSLKRKVKISVGLFVVSIFLLVGSFIPYGLSQAQEADLYKSKLEIAVQSERTDDYIEAISINPVELQPYTGLIDSFKVDGVFSKEEEDSLLNLVNPNLDEIKSKKDYGQLAYNIGKLYWFYYEGADGDTVSSRWFKEAIDSGFDMEKSKVYYDLGNFKKTISMAITESSDSGMYKEYWNNLKKSKNIDSGEIIELQVYNSIADVIQSYAYRLKTDGIPKEDVLKEVEGVESYLSAYKPVSDKSIELYNELKEKSKSLRDVVNVAYSRGGAE